MLGILVAVAAGALIGGAVGTARRALRLPAIIVTLAGSFIIGGAALLILPRPGGAVPDWLSDPLAGNTPTALILLVLLLSLGSSFWRRRSVSLYAAGDNPVGAYRSGVTSMAAHRRLCDQRPALELGRPLRRRPDRFGDPVIGTFHAELDRGRGARRRRLSRRPGHHARRLAGSLLLSLMINVMFFLGFPPVAQYVAQGLIIIGAVALPQSRASAEGMWRAVQRMPIGRWLLQPVFLTFLVVALVWIVAGFAKPGFGSYGHLRYLVELAAVIGLVAAGQTFVVIAGGIDLSVASTITVAPSCCRW